MKRIPVLLLSLCVLVACVPTPEQEFVVNKGDNIAEQKLNETPAPDASGEGSTVLKQTFPDRWDEDPIVENDRLIVRANTEIHVRTDGLYPVYRTRPTEITKETVENIAIKFLDKPMASSEALLTKEDWGRELQRFLDMHARSEEWAKAGKPDGWADVEDLNETPEEFEERTGTWNRSKKRRIRCLNKPSTTIPGWKCTNRSRLRWRPATWHGLNLAIPSI